MIFNVTTYLKQQEMKSENIKIQNKQVYGILNKYIRYKENNNKKDN